MLNSWHGSSSFWPHVFLPAGELNKQLAGASNSTGSSLQDLGTQFSAAQAAASEAATSLAGQLSESSNNALQTLPAPVRDAILAAARPVSKVSRLPEKVMVKFIIHLTFEGTQNKLSKQRLA